MKKIVIGTLLSAVLVSTVFAVSSERNLEQVYKECGIGGMLFANSSPIGAITSNVTWDWGSTALSSNASSADTCTSTKVKAAEFIHKSYDAIITNVANGNGDYLKSLSNLSGKDVKELRGTVHSLMSASDYSNQTAIQKSSNLYSAIM